MKRRIILFTNAAILATIIVLPGWSITTANIMAETGLLTRVDGEHAILLPWANYMGISLFNLIAITGLLIVVNTLISATYQIRSPQNT